MTIDEMIRLVLDEIGTYEDARLGHLFPMGGVQTALIRKGYDDAIFQTATEEMLVRNLLEWGPPPMARLTPAGIKML